MNFNPGPYVPLPLSDDRSETPPPDANPQQPFTGLELIVSGLPSDTFISATEHLKATIENLRRQGAEIPELHISSPANVQPLDFVYVSLTGDLRETPRPDILERVRCQLDSVERISALWKVAPGRNDKTRQAYFQVDDTLNPTEIKVRLDRILQQDNHHYQNSYIPANSNRIIYHFLKVESIVALTNHPIILDHCSYFPHRPRYVQPSYGLEIAIPGVGEFSGVRAAIDNYIERTYGPEGPHEPIVHRSHLALDDTVYCVVLSTLEITQRLLADRDVFRPFGDSPLRHDKPQYVYTLNSNSIPLFFNSRSFTSSTQSDTILHRRLDIVNAHSEATAASLKEVISDVKQLAHGFQEAQATITKAFTDSTAVYSANSQLTAAQFDVSSLLQTISTNNILLGIAAPDRRPQIQAELESLNDQLNEARTVRAC